jgi:acetoacetyl-CoA synthetase
MAKLLWEPSESRKASANLTGFIRDVNQKHGLDMKDYFDLHKWSISDLSNFWQAIWDYGQVIHSAPARKVLEHEDKMPGAKWFPGAKLNFAENLLRFRDDQPALVFYGENEGEPRSISYAQLYDQVARLAAGLKELGVEPGDRVAGFMPNIPETVMAMLATASLGAIWSSCSPDFGFQGVMDRFGQIQPKVLFCADGYFYNGKTFSSLERAAQVASDIESIQKVVVAPFTTEEPDISMVPGAVSWQKMLDRPLGEPQFAQLPFDHPLYILYSSGTTGVPKCMVHGAGNVLLLHIKELALQSDVKRESNLFYFTTCGWMMWNWLVSGLTLGATCILFDGSPFHPDPAVLWRMAQKTNLTHFGTSARYLGALENSGLRPNQDHDLSALKAVLSTGSPLSQEGFDYVYRDIKDDVCLSSISGGSDMVGCFVAGNPIGPVYRGQIQAPCLGLDVQAWSPAGQPLLGEKGELVCTKPWPTMPVYFWNDPDGSKYQAAYFERFPGVWHHGDYIEMTPEGGAIIYGRSDATLNPGGVRIGTAEIYRQVENHTEIADSLVIGQDWQDDVRVILFIKLNPGVVFDEELIKKIKTTIRANTSPRHVPAKIIPVEDIPYTISGKKVELAVRNVIHGREVKNKDALANPQALELYDGLEDLKN